MEPLPAELFYHIAEYVSHETLHNLRLASRTVRFAVEPSFLVTFFHERHYAFTRYAMQNLVEVSALDVLRKRLNRLVFCVSNPYYWDIEGIRTIIERSREGGPPQTLQDQLPHPDDFICYVANYTKIVSECTALLATALRQLTEAGVRPALEFRTQPDGRCVRPYGARRRAEAMRGLQRINLCPRRTEDVLQRPFP